MVAATALAMRQGREQAPSLLPVAAFGAKVALGRRAEEGGSPRSRPARRPRCRRTGCVNRAEVSGGCATSRRWRA